MYVCIPYVCVCGAPGGQKAAPDPLEVELLTVVSCHEYWDSNPGEQQMLLTTKPVFGVLGASLCIDLEFPI